MMFLDLLDGHDLRRWIAVTMRFLIRPIVLWIPQQYCRHGGFDCRRSHSDYNGRVYS